MILFSAANLLLFTRVNECVEFAEISEFFDVYAKNTSSG